MQPTSEHLLKASIEVLRAMGDRSPERIIVVTMLKKIAKNEGIDVRSY